MSTMWVQTQHQLTPSSGFAMLDLLGVVLNLDQQVQERSTIVSIRGTAQAAAYRTDASSGSFEFYMGLFVGHKNMDVDDVQTLDDNSLVSMGWLWKAHVFSYLWGDGTLPVYTMQWMESLDIRSKRKLGRGQTLFSVVQTVNTAYTAATVNLRANVLLNVA